jgi:cholesterol transport system auxiliary component
VRPSALLGLDTQRLLLASGGGDVPVFDDMRWMDSLPAVVQSSTIRAFENAGYARVIDDSGSDPEDFQLRLDLRAFHIRTTPTAAAEVEFAAKVLDASGRVVDARTFTGTEPVARVDDGAVALNCLEAAFARAATDLVPWTLGVANGIEAAASPPPAR